MALTVDLVLLGVARRQHRRFIHRLDGRSDDCHPHGSVLSCDLRPRRRMCDPTRLVLALARTGADFGIVRHRAMCPISTFWYSQRGPGKGCSLERERCWPIDHRSSRFTSVHRTTTGTNAYRRHTRCMKQHSPVVLVARPSPLVPKALRPSDHCVGRVRLHPQFR